jgi:DNA primase
MLLEYLEQIMGTGTRHATGKGIQYSFDCCFCDDTKERLFFNMDRQAFYCHNCEVKGSAVAFLMIYNHVDYREALKIYRDLEGYEKPLPEDLEQEIYTRLFVTPHTEIEQKKYVYPLPQEFTLMEHATGSAGRKAVEYLRKRGVTGSMCERYYIGYCAEGRYANRIIMPDFEDGELIYWQARTWLPTPKSILMKKMFRKVMNPSLTEEQVANGVISVDKSQVISNIDFVRQQGVGVVCEGKFDAYAIGDFGACTHGKHMSDDQFIKLVSNKDKIQCVYVMYDADAVKNTLSTAKRLSMYFDDVYMCILPYGEDPSSLGTKKCIESVNNAIKYTAMSEVKLRLKGLI